jgi:hypothetical protein
MGWLTDAVLCGALFFAAYTGLKTGFRWQLVSAGSILAGVLLGLACAPWLAPLFAGVTREPFHARLAAFLLVASLVGFGLRMAAVYHEASQEETLPNEQLTWSRWSDCVAGGAFGALKGMLLAAVLAACAISLWPAHPAWEGATLTQRFADTGSRILPAGAPQQTKAWVRGSLETAREGLQIKLAPAAKREPVPPPSAD